MTLPRHRSPGRRAAASLAAAAALALAPAACSTAPRSYGPSVASTPTPSGTTGADRLSPVPLTVAAGVDAGAAAGRSLNLPTGWSGQVWANVPGARMAAWTPDGRLVVSTGGNRRLVLLTPAAGGRGPAATTLLGDLDGPQGVAFTRQDGRDVLVVGETSRLVTWTYAGGAVSGRRVLIDGLPTGGHASKMVAVRDGRVVYNVGSATNRDPKDRTADPQRATIAEIGLDGTGNRTLATGVRNGEGLSFAPDGTLFTAVNQGDNQPYPFHDGRMFGRTVRAYINENPVDQVSRITPGTDLGWPYCLPDTRGRTDLRGLGYVADPEFNADGRALDCAGIGRTQLGLPAHSAPVGFGFTHGSALPAALANGALITAHGSWNRQPPREPYVAYAPWDGATATLQTPQLVVTGFQNPDGSRWGRCVDAVPGPDGSLYVTDDAAGLVYRLTPPAA